MSAGRTAILRGMPTHIPTYMLTGTEWAPFLSGWGRRGRYIRGDQVIGYTVAIYGPDGEVTRVRHFRF